MHPKQGDETHGIPNATPSSLRTERILRLSLYRFLHLFFFFVVKCSYESSILKHLKCTRPFFVVVFERLVEVLKNTFAFFFVLFSSLCLSVAQWSSEDKVLKGLQALHLTCLVVQRYARVHRRLKCDSARCQASGKRLEQQEKKKKKR